MSTRNAAYVAERATGVARAARERSEQERET